MHSIMKDTSPIELTIAFTDPDFNDEERDRQVQNLLRQVKDLEIIEAGPIPDPNPPQGVKAMAGTLAGLLAIQILEIHVKEILDYLRDRLSHKIIEFEVEANGKRLKVKASNPEEIDMAIRKAREFIQDEKPGSPPIEPRQPNRTTIEAMRECEEDLPSFASADESMARLHEAR